MHRPRLNAALLAASLLAFSVPSFADKVVMLNGDIINGTVSSLNRGRLQIRSAYASTITLSWSQLQSLEIVAPIVFLFEDDSSFVGTVKFNDLGHQFFDGQGVEVPSLELADVLRIYRQPKKTLIVSDNGSAYVFAEFERSNVDSDELRIDLRHTRQRERQRHRGDLSLVQKSVARVLTKHTQKIEYRFDQFSLASEWFGGINMSYQRDDSKALSRWISAGPSVGKRFSNTPFLQASAEGGLNFVREFHEGQGWTIHEALRWSSEVSGATRLDNLSAFHRNDILWRFDSARVTFDTKSGMEYEIRQDISLVTQIETIYDSQPIGAERYLSYKFSIGLGYKW